MIRVRSCLLRIPKGNSDHHQKQRRAAPRDHLSGSGLFTFDNHPPPQYSHAPRCRRGSKYVRQTGKRKQSKSASSAARTSGPAPTATTSPGSNASTATRNARNATNRQSRLVHGNLEIRIHAGTGFILKIPPESVPAPRTCVVRTCRTPSPVSVFRLSLRFR